MSCAPAVPHLRPAGRRATAGAVAVGVSVLGLLGAACGEPAARAVRAPDSPLSYVIPAGFTTLAERDSGTFVYGQPGASPEEMGESPVLYMATLAEGDAMSFEILRRIATGDEYDPLDPSAASVPGGARVIDYEEIADARVWGIRLKLVVSDGAKDFQALVDRATDKVVVTELACTQVCFKRQTKLIEQIQGSWSLES